MKMQFNLIINGNESLGKKFEKEITTNANLNMDLVRSFGQTIMLAFRLSEEDQISIESFRAGRINEEIPEIIEKKEEIPVP